MKPIVGQIVHYRSYGTPGGEYTSQCRAAVVTQVHVGEESGCCIVSMAVLNPEGMFFDRGVPYDAAADRGGTWHWPEREDSDG